MKFEKPYGQIGSYVSEEKYWDGSKWVAWKEGDGFSNNHYLITHNNCAMIQTGHSNGAATIDEQHIIANVLLYLAQFSVDTFADDRSARDMDAPNRPNAARIGTSAQISVNTSDLGTRYQYYISASDLSDQSKVYKSDVVSEYCTTGLKGYFISEDNDPDGVPEIARNASTGVITSPLTLSAEDAEPLVYNASNRGAYVHIMAVDWAGNLSEVTTVPPLSVGIEINNPDIAADGVSFEKFYGLFNGGAEKTAADWDNFFKSLVSVSDAEGFNAVGLTADYADFLANMQFGGVLGDYNISYAYVNAVGDLIAAATVKAVVADTTPALITAAHSSLDWFIGDPGVPDSDPGEFLKSAFGFGLSDKQDDEIPANWAFDFGGFDINSGGAYTITADYVDPAGNASIRRVVEANVKFSDPGIGTSNAEIKTNGLTFEKVYGDNADWDTFLRGLIDEYDTGDGSAFDPARLVITMGGFEANMLKNGVLGDYPIHYAYTTEISGFTAEYGIILKIRDTTPADIIIPGNISVNGLTIPNNTVLSDTPYSTWREYAIGESGLSVNDEQDDYAENRLVLGLDAFNPSRVGTYPVTVDYTDPASNVSIRREFKITVYNVFAPTLEAQPVIVERGSDIGDSDSDRIEYIKLHAGIIVDDPEADDGEIAAQGLLEGRFDESKLVITGVGVLDTVNPKNNAYAVFNAAENIYEYTVGIEYENSVGTASALVAFKVKDTIKPVVTLTTGEISLSAGQAAPNLMSFVKTASDTDASGLVTEIALGSAVYTIYNSSHIQISAINSAVNGVYSVEYTVNDGYGNISEPAILIVTVSGGKTETETPIYEPTATPNPEATATPNPEISATPNPEASATPNPEATATPNPESTATPNPESSERPDKTPSPTLPPIINVTRPTDGEELEIKAENLVETEIDGVFEWFDDNGAPLGYVKLFVNDDGTEEWILVDAFGEPLGGAKANPVTWNAQALGVELPLMIAAAALIFGGLIRKKTADGRK
jgi:hypothetical protein